MRGEPDARRPRRREPYEHATALRTLFGELPAGVDHVRHIAALMSGADVRHGGRPG